MQRNMVEQSNMETMHRMQQFNTMGTTRRSANKRMPGAGRYQYEIELRNGDVIVREGRIEKYEIGDVFIVGNNRNFKIIKPDSTVRMSRVYGDEKLVGLPYGNNWVFRVVTGAIQGYSPYPDRSPRHVAYMQIERGGVVERVDIDYLRGRMAGHEEALALLEMEKVGEAMQRYNRDMDDEVEGE
ncbi:hypothetical protein [Dawidia soli]|uniref:Uncharacterized protein n=1 Tax=Dawidia soli TaxID=2782352 RepID=A0AAP2DC30_9BACT|nr:hypothetical protein [Dawidia soli]MBT1689004.1 hypothetical protein [Dawidia soli]